MPDKHLPSFFIVGVQKAGTTSVHDWLIQQPDIRLPSLKETHFFSHDNRYKKGLGWYIRQFPPERENKAYKVTGEIDPEYAFFPQTPVRIKTIIKEPKIIFIFRNPIERAFSQYNMSVYRGFENLSFRNALIEEKKRMNEKDDGFSIRNYSYLSRGNYTEQVKRYLDLFPNSNFLFIKFDDLFISGKADDTYDEICRFIGIESDSEIADRSRISNPSGTPKSSFLRNLIYNKSLFRTLAGKIVQTEHNRSKIKNAINQLNLKKNRRDEKSKVDYNHLPDFAIENAANEIQSIQKITQLDLGNWLQKFK